MRRAASRCIAPSGRRPLADHRAAHRQAAALQGRILAAAAPLSTWRLLVYSVCTLTAEESIDHPVPAGFDVITDVPSPEWRAYGHGWRGLPQTMTRWNDTDSIPSHVMSESRAPSRQVLTVSDGVIHGTSEDLSAPRGRPAHGRRMGRRRARARPTVWTKSPKPS